MDVFVCYILLLLFGASARDEKRIGSTERVFMVPGEKVHLCLKKGGWGGGGQHAAAVHKGYRDVHCAKPISQKDLHVDWFYFIRFNLKCCHGLEVMCVWAHRAIVFTHNPSDPSLLPPLTTQTILPNTVPLWVMSVGSNNIYNRLLI